MIPTWLWIVGILVAWMLLGLGIGMLLGPLLRENAKRYPVAPGEEEDG